MLRQFAILLLAGCAFQAQAKVDMTQAARLGSDLTPLGAERAGNAAGTIPAWDGGITSAPAGYQPGMHHLDPFKSDAVQYVINSKNMGQYQAMLPEGLKTLLQKQPEYFLQVYPTRRSASAPQRIYDATRMNALNAELISGGNGVEGVAAGVPFPLPKDGQEAIWNHIMRYRGEQIHFVTNQAAVLSNGSYTLLKLERDIYFLYGRDGMTPQGLNNTLFYYKYNVVAPSKLAGSALVVQETLDQVLAIRKAWRFSRGERRVRRLPMLAYDSLQPDTNGMATADVVDSYNGAPDRYEWTLSGKREMLVPYNSYAVHQQGIPYEDILKSKTVNPQLLRYELHRVWVVEANLRKGFSHPYAKRRFYLDEDSWQILAVDVYDKKGALVGLQESHPINYYDAPMFGSTLETIYDFPGNRYFADGLDNNEPMYDFKAKLAPIDFTPQALRREGN
ncbi:MAG: outer membrane lipoprotein-sorting protein [Pseudomonas sp. PGPPP3]|nr:MAG: outer membrane lipoprotein-sorting protein [Pseudomonas sp. PGPPP3]